ncbi:MAG TPA: LysR family transcriptional regulator [Conexibacter sp.]|jgi:DNA-binding transcriptional LysR family regulator
MIDVRRLRVLREVAVAGTISGAARALGYTPSAVSQQLAALARESGAELLRRRGRYVELTAEGRLLVEVAERVGAELEAAEAELAARAAQPRGVVRLLAFATALRTFVPRAVALLAERAPGLELEIDEADPDDALRLLAQERADVVVAHDYDLLERRRHTPVHRRELVVDELRVVGEVGDAGGAASAGGGASAPLPLAALAGRDWVLPDLGSACDRVVERACASAGFAPKAVARSADFGAIAMLADACGAVALVPRLGLEGNAPLPASRPLESPVGRQVFAAVRDGAERRPLESAILDALAAAAGPPSVAAAPAAPRAGTAPVPS